MLASGNSHAAVIEEEAAAHGGISTVRVSVFSGKPPRRCACLDYADGCKGFLDDISAADAAQLLELVGTGERHGA